MAEVMKIATRDSYGTALVQLADAGHDDLVVFDADLSASTKTCVFQKAYPKRFFNCGIAEANMMGVAAGMSTFGYVPFVSSFAMFAAGRAWEQVRNSIGYPHLNVKIAATHGGLSVGEDGASHQCCEDFALMRAIPGMVVLCPADDVEARAAVKAAYSHEGPVYLRLSRLATPLFHDPDKYTFEIGKGETLTDGFDIAVISTGLMTSEVLKAAVQLKKQGSLSVRGTDLHVEKLARGYAWLDTGTHESMLDAANFIRTIESRQGLQVACLQEIAYNNGWMTREEVRESIQDMMKTEYGQYLARLIEEE